MGISVRQQVGMGIHDRWGWVWTVKPIQNCISHEWFVIMLCCSCSASL